MDDCVKVQKAQECDMLVGIGVELWTSSTQIWSLTGKAVSPKSCAKRFVLVGLMKRLGVSTVSCLVAKATSATSFHMRPFTISIHLHFVYKVDCNAKISK